MRVKHDVKIRGGEYNDAHKHAQHGTLLKYCCGTHQGTYLDDCCECPDQEEAPDCEPAACVQPVSSSVASIGGNNHVPVSEPNEHGQNRRPAKPPHGP